MNDALLLLTQTDTAAEIYEALEYIALDEAQGWDIEETTER